MKNTIILSGKELGKEIKDSVAKKSAAFCKKTGRKPCLAVVLVGKDAASCIYVNNKKKACDDVGIDHVNIEYEEAVSEERLLDCVRNLNYNPKIDGILVQLPLPSHISENEIINSIHPDKDVDGFTPANMGKLLLGEDSLVACTPKGILRLLDNYGIKTESKNVCIVGRSNIVGKPLAALLMQKNRNATVSVCHRATSDLKTYTQNADIIVTAAGHVNLITSEMVKDGAVVIDVGMNRVPDSSTSKGYVLKGDADFDGLLGKAAAITPVPGGVGPMTIAMLMENTLIAACKAEHIEVKSL